MKHNRCNAKTRQGTPCQCQPVPGKRRCKFHGGLSTGPKTAEGRQRSLEALARGRGCLLRKVDIGTHQNGAATAALLHAGTWLTHGLTPAPTKKAGPLPAPARLQSLP